MSSLGLGWRDLGRTLTRCRWPWGRPGVPSTWWPLQLSQCQHALRDLALLRGAHPKGMELPLCALPRPCFWGGLAAV